MTIFVLLAMGVMFGFIFGYVCGLFQTDGLPHRVKGQLGGYTPSQISGKRPSPPGKE